MGLLLCLLVSPSIGLADIFEWEWVNPADHSQGKQQSTTVVPGGAGLVPGPGLYATNKNLTQAYLTGFDLTDASFSAATLANADFTDSVIREANFSISFTSGGSGITSSQLYSTSSYQVGDLSGIELDRNDLTGWDFVGQNLHDAHFRSAVLTDANFAGADVSEADFVGTTDSGFTAE